MNAARAWLAPALLAVLAGGCTGAWRDAALPQAPAAAVRAAPSSAALTYGTYEWNAADAIRRWQAGTLWSWLAAKHVNDVLAGFDSAQIAQYSTAKGAATFNRFIAQAGSHGVRVELLLGDPHWILPSGVASLKQILSELRAVRFAGLNLDLEPNQVKGHAMKTVARDLASAMHAYVAASRWPVTLDLNWIYANPAFTGGYCLVCGLQRAGLLRIDLMTYIADPSKVVKRDRPILARWPDLRFWIAQSVEPPSVLPKSDSYWSDGFTTFYREMHVLDRMMRASKNYEGLTIEAMGDLETMPSH